MIITINNKTLEELSLVLLKGTLDNLLKPAEKKALVFNENASIDGSKAITTNRKVKRRDVSLLFLIKDYSAIDLYRKCEWLDQFLTEGVYKGGIPTGVNEIKLVDIDVTFRLVYNKMDKYSGFGDGKASISLNFTELNPKNRAD